MLRFIPAHAGNTVLPRWWSGSSPVHPRACGEYTNTIMPRHWYAGSSPRMRGIHLLYFFKIIEQFQLQVFYPSELLKMGLQSYEDNYPEEDRIPI